MQIWTTFSPKKIFWELSVVKSNGEHTSSAWEKDISVIKDSLTVLKDHGIYGIKLVDFPFERVDAGKTFSLEDLDVLLNYCYVLNLKVDWCLGPYQYPYHPGIRIPKSLRSYLSPSVKHIDEIPILKDYGHIFLKEQLELLGNDKRINGFYLGNEWPDFHQVEGKEDIKIGVSEKFMLEAIETIKNKTSKPVMLNTNINVSLEKLIFRTFYRILSSLGEQGELGLDIYPSRENWIRTPDIKLAYLLKSFKKRFHILESILKPKKIFFAEIEAQPWGKGQSWYELITKSRHPNKKVLKYSNKTLLKTFKSYIPRNTEKLYLWGADFWLASHLMGINWPLDQIKNFKNK